MREYFKHRNWQAQEQIIAIASSPQGATRKEFLAAQVGLSTSGLDLALKRLVTEGLISFTEEPRERSTGFATNHPMSKRVRVYRSAS